MENFLKKCPDKICRTCLSESADMKSLNTKIEGEHRTLLEILSFVVNLRILPRENLPGQVCKGCEEIICKASTFKRRCFEVETLLDQCIQDCLQNVTNTEDALLKHESLLQEMGTTIEVVAHPSVPPVISSESLKITAEDNIISSSLVEKSHEKMPIVKEEDDFFHADSVADISAETFQMPYESELNNMTLNMQETQTNEGHILICQCGEIFFQKQTYKSHLKTKRCKRKKERLSRKRSNVQNCSLSTENKVQSTENTTTCPECNMTFESSRACKIHQRKHKSPHKPQKTEETGKFQCSQCLRHFKKKSSIAAHLKLHERKSKIKYECQTCKRDFKHKAHLDNHLLTGHTKSKGFLCTLCDTKFSTQLCLDVHKETHNVEKKHQCGLCKKAFNMLSTLTDHMRTHTGEKPFLCSFCGKGFSQRTNLAQHVRRHQGLKPFGCEHCDQRFVSKGELTAHTRKHSGAHPFICDDCGSGFTTSSSLVKHRRTHTGEKPYACDMCSMRFAASGTLKNHRRTHTGEKPYRCLYCVKAFVQRHDLITHIRCHTGERPYTCQCGQAFRKASALKTHVKMHEKDGTMLERDATVLHRDTTVLQKDATMLQKDATTLQRDATTLQRDATTLQSDAMLQKCSSVLPRGPEQRGVAMIERDGMSQSKEELYRDMSVLRANILRNFNMAGNCSNTGNQ